MGATVSAHVCAAFHFFKSQFDLLKWKAILYIYIWNFVFFIAFVNSVESEEWAAHSS